MGVITGDNQRTPRRDDCGALSQRLALQRVQCANALFAQRDQFVQLVAGKGAALACALQLDERAGLVHDEIHVRLRGAVLGIAQIQTGRIRHQPGADGGKLMHDGGFLDFPRAQQLIHRAAQRHKAARDGGRARAAVGLEHIAVDGDRSFAQIPPVDCLPQRAADEPADFHAAAVLLHAVARLAPPR